MDLQQLSLEKNSLFSGLTPRELGELAAHLIPQEFSEGAILFREGEPGDHLYIVESGVIGIYLGPQEGQPTQIGTVGSGGCVGEMSILTGEPRSATARALTPLKLLSMSGQDFLVLTRASPTVLLNANRILSQRLHQTNKAVVQRPGQIFALMGSLPLPAAQWLATHLALALAAIGGKPTLLLNLMPPVPGVPGLPHTLSLDRFLASPAGSSPPGDGVSPSERVLSVAPTTWQGELIQSEDMEPLVLAMDRGLRQAEYTVVNTLGLAPDTFSSLWQGVHPDLLKRIAKVLWVVEDTSYLTNHGRYAQRLREGLSLPAEKVLWLVVSPAGPRPSQGVRKRWENLLGGRVVGVVSVDGSRTQTENLQVPWERGPLWASCLEAARHCCEKTIGLAFASGGARAVAQLRVLQGLEALGLPVDYCAGTSAGALVGSLWALGNKPDALLGATQHLLRSWQLRQVFLPALPRRSLLWGRGLQRLVHRLLGDNSFADTIVPFSAVAADTSGGHSVVLQDGLLWPAVVASCSVPVIFPPMRHQGGFLVDGSLMEPVPCATLRRMGADLIIALNTNCTKQDIALWQEQGLLPEVPPERTGETKRFPNLLSTSVNAFAAMAAEIATQSTLGADLSIRPRFATWSWYDTSKVQDFIQAGAVAVEEAAQELRRLLPWLGQQCPVLE
ncbi:MAG: cyclic nucleotide-binding domain-containing protein [Chloroflexi bacterium]|nr:cyclic nucleotide-binding domain-containing protein [Chloroflexota bacterium]